jgi:hypothetical protein
VPDKANVKQQMGDAHAALLIGVTMGVDLAAAFGLLKGRETRAAVALIPGDVVLWS